MKNVIKANKKSAFPASGIAINDRRWFLESNARRPHLPRQDNASTLCLRDKRRGNRIVARWCGRHPPLVLQRLLRRFRLHAPRVDSTQAAAQLSALGIARNYGAIRDLALVSEPAWLLSAGLDRFQRMIWLAPLAHSAWLQMQRAACATGVRLEIVSAFRSAHYQNDLLRRKLTRGDTIETILRVSAAPGFSEHHSGRAIDFAEIGAEAMTDAFAGTLSFLWLEKNAARFGFHLSFPADNRHGVMYEPWHWCYRGDFKKPGRRNGRA
jgi:zinc D-Ala-D-Ala carboxypeptidase